MADMTASLIDQVQGALDERQPLRIQGGNTKAFLGRKSNDDEQVLSLAKHTGVISYQPVELVMTARAGTQLSEIEAVLDEHNQVMAFEPPHFGSTDTLGGTLACNLSGPGRPWTGSVRDHLLGVRLINGRGEHLRFGGQVMKNVAGYDISRLQAGAMGGLGVLTELSFKVLPKPALTLTLRESCSEAEALVMMNKRAQQPKPMTAATWVDGYLYTRLSGAESAVSSTAKSWGGEQLETGPEFWRSIQNQSHPFFQSGEPLWRLSIKSSADPLIGESPCLVDWGGAQRWYSGSYEPEKMRALAEKAGGQAMLFRGGADTAEVNHPLPEAIQKLQKRIKRSMDPKGIFNPGRVYGWL